MIIQKKRRDPSRTTAQSYEYIKIVSTNITLIIGFMKYFSFQEFEHSETATRYAIDNNVPDKLKGNVAALVDMVLDPLREAWGKPITVTSGYRCEELNRRVGGVKTSQHMTGEAVDITTGNRVENRRLFQLIQELKLPFDQLIDEKNFSWVHVSHRANGRNRGEVLKL